MSWRYRAAFFALLASPALVAFLAPYLPFQDWPGHLGVIGALIHLDEPAARINELVEFTGWFGPNRGLYWAGTGLGTLFGPRLGGQIVMAFVLGAFGPAMAWLCRAAGADDRLAFLALPLAFGRHLYCGFVLNAAGLVFLMLGIAAYLDVLRKPDAKRAIILVLVMSTIPFVHGFFYLVTAGLIAWCLVVDLVRRRYRAVVIGAGALAVSFAALLPQLSSIGGADPNAPSLFTAVTTAAANADRSRLPTEFWEWLFASYRYATLDDWFQGIWIAVIAILLVLAVALERRHFFFGFRWRLLVLALITGAMFWWLPSYIGPPLNWWGGNLRLPIVVAILIIPTIGLIGRTRANWPIRIAGGFSLVIVLVAGFDLVRFSAVEMDGFAQVVRSIPPGKTIAPLHYTPRNVHEYPGEPHGYVGNYYILESGGLVPQNLFEVKDLPFKRRKNLPAPPWGNAAGFQWAAHGAMFDGFLVRKNPSAPDAPFRKNDDRVRLVIDSGNWRYYERVVASP